jgi:hypothetical protein
MLRHRLHPFRVDARGNTPHRRLSTSSATIVHFGGFLNAGTREDGETRMRCVRR